MKLNLTTISKGIVGLMGLGLLSICGILIPEIAREEWTRHPGDPFIFYFLIGSWILSAPIFAALYQSFKLLGLIEKKKSFSPASVKALQTVQMCTLIFMIMFALADTALVINGKNSGEDMPPFVLFGGIIMFVSLIIVTFVAVLKRLVQEAMAIKSENDEIV